MTADMFKDFARKDCYRPDKPEVVAFYLPLDCMIYRNLAASPTANIYELCFVSADDMTHYLTSLELDD